MLRQLVSHYSISPRENLNEGRISGTRQPWLFRSGMKVGETSFLEANRVRQKSSGNQFPAMPIWGSQCGLNRRAINSGYDLHTQYSRKWIDFGACGSGSDGILAFEYSRRAHKTTEPLGSGVEMRDRRKRDEIASFRLIRTTNQFGSGVYDFEFLAWRSASSAAVRARGAARRGARRALAEESVKEERRLASEPQPRKKAGMEDKRTDGGAKRGASTSHPAGKDGSGEV